VKVEYMDKRPEQPAEGKLIEDATADLDISIREAAKRAGISYGRWRQIVKGYQNVSPGVYAEVRNAPAKTVARMAAVAGVTPELMETKGQRPDVAEVMRRRDDISAPERPARTRVTSALSGGPDLESYLDIIDRERAAGIPPRSPGEQRIWESWRYSETEKRNLIATIRQLDDDSARDFQRNTGLTPARLAIAGNGTATSG
jgi:hypothetical protein